MAVIPAPVFTAQKRADHDKVRLQEPGLREAREYP
jgi:hypothetical protein